MRWPPEAASPADRDGEVEREVPVSRSWREDREVEDREEGARVRLVKPTGLPEGDWPDEAPLPGWLTWLQEFRFIRDRTTTADHIAYAQDGAHAIKEGPWRYANLVFAYVAVPIGTLLCDGIKWAFFQRLSRCLLAIPTALALFWALNHIPVLAWLIPDGWDFTTWWVDSATVEVPIDISTGEG